MIAWLVIITGSIFLFETILLARAFLYARRERGRVWESYAPKVAVIAPHFGWDRQTEENARRILALDYPGEYEVLFVTHGAGGRPDRSWEQLGKIAGGSDRARVILARDVVRDGIQRSQKAENMLAALAEVSEDVEAFAFMDADAGVARDWLTKLVEPLQDERIGVATGARFYAPLVPSIASYTEAVWVNYQIALYGEPKIGMVWGGSSAIRRDVFERTGILGRWRRATFEDQHLTRAMAEHRLRIHFAPDCVPVHYTRERSWRQVLEFTNRQMTVTFWMKLYLSWWLSLTLLLPKGIIYALTIPLVLLEPRLCWPLLAVPALESLRYLLFTRIIPETIRKDRRIGRSMYATSLAVPHAMLLGGINGISAMFKKSIVWGGVRYRNRVDRGCEMLGRVFSHPVEPREGVFRRVAKGVRQPLARILNVADPGVDWDDLAREED